MESNQMKCPKLCNFFKYHWNGLYFTFVPLILSPIWICIPGQFSKFMYIMSIIVFFWTTDCIPLPVTSLLPIMFLPLCNIFNSDFLCRIYLKEGVMLIMCLLIIGTIIEGSDTHKKIGATILNIFGKSPVILYWSLSLITSILAALCTDILAITIMKSVAKNIISNTGESFQNERPYQKDNWTKCVYIGIGYSAAIGGTNHYLSSCMQPTLNIYLKEKLKMQSNFPDKVFPYIFTISVLMIGPTLLWLQFLFLGSASFTKSQSFVEAEYTEVSPPLENWSINNVLAIAVVVTAVVVTLWLHPSAHLNILEDKFKILPTTSTIFLMMIVFVALILPAKWYFLKYFYSKKRKKSQQVTLLSWKTVQEHTPWGIVFYLGCTRVMSMALKETLQLPQVTFMHEVLRGLSYETLLICCIITASFLATFCSSFISMSFMVHILTDSASQKQINSLNFLIPSGVSCGLALSLPQSSFITAYLSGRNNMGTLLLIKAGVLPSIWSMILVSSVSLLWSYLTPGYSKNSPVWLQKG